MKKVYCKDCKWLNLSNDEESSCNWCDDKYVIKDTWYAPKQKKWVSGTYNSAPPIVNKDNNCDKYKRKWWKVWA